MCRIYGYFGTPIDDGVPPNVATQMITGGPDDQTCWSRPGVALGSNRLAVQGINTGAQPFRLGRLTLVFNGEIYNHDALRRELIQHGYRFRGNCDGEVLLPLYERYGDAFVTKLHGMYAIALHDAREEPTLKVFVDHAGMKSLYYFLSAEGRRLSFASELRALAHFPEFPDAIDTLAIDRYLGGKAVWGPDTIYRQVKTLPPNGFLQFDARGLRLATSPPPHVPAWQRAGCTLREAAHRLDETLQDELSRMLTADVPVCVITSGGLDSSYLTALSSHLQGNVSSFHIAYRGQWPSDERGYAREVAEHCGTQHHEVELDPRDFPSIIGRYIEHLDQPNNAPHSLSTFALFEAIHDAGFKVAVTGDGADELFAGYTRFAKAASDSSANWHRGYQDTMAACRTQALASLYQPEYSAEVAAAGGYFADRSGDELDRLVGASTLDKLETLLRYDRYQRFPYYILRRVDHLSMAHSVEARMPFLQPAVVDLANHLDSATKVADGVVKAPVIEAARRWVPQSVIARPKQPFTLPIAAMMRPGEALYDLVGDTLLTNDVRCARFCQPGAIKTMFRQQGETANAATAETLWSLLVLESWFASRTINP